MTNSFDGAWGGPFDSENDDTIEMVLSDSAMQLLSQAAAAVESARPIANPVVKEAGVQVGGGVKPVARSAGETKLAARMPGIPQGRPVVDVLIVGEAKPTTDSRVVPQPPPDRRPPMSRLRFAVILSLVAVGSAILTAVTYSVLTGPRPAGSAETNVSAPAVPRTAASMVPLASGGSRAPVLVADLPASPIPSPAAPGALAESSTEPAPTVRFVNPFDRREVFEFPAGTSHADARDAVAEVLAERASERQSQLRAAPRRNGKTADRGTPVVAGGLAPRS